MSALREDIAALAASVPTRTVVPADTPTRVDLPAVDHGPVMRPSSQEIRAALPEVVALVSRMDEQDRRLARIEAMMGEAATERIRRQAKEELERDLKAMQKAEDERRAKNVGRWIAVTTALLTTLGGIIVQIVQAAK